MMNKLLIDRKLVDKSKKYLPKLIEKECNKFRIVNEKDAKGLYTQKYNAKDKLDEIEFKTGDSIIIDFMDHHVGYFEFRPLLFSGVFDAPLFLKISFGENLRDFETNLENYKGTLSAGWIQQEYIHIDELGEIIRLKRRYAVRYVKIDIIATSNNFSCTFDSIKLRAVSSADMNKLIKADLSGDLKKIDDIAVKTLHECMQTVFEDGPKRDQRLWVGDLRLQALVNYLTFKNTELVKRCLYLLGGIKRGDGAVFACLARKEETEVDSIFLTDYSLLFCSCVYDYYIETKDRELLDDLWDTVIRQAEIAMENTDENGLIKDIPDKWWSFIDWQENLNKQLPTQGVLIYALRQIKTLAQEMNDIESIKKIDEWLDKTCKSALKFKGNDLFITANGDVASCAAQIWLVLADILPKEANRKILTDIFERDMIKEIKTPYLIHYLLEAMYNNGMSEEVVALIKKYWGGMANKGTDCFWEIYDENDEGFSPYNCVGIHSYCHAWSCTPSYFIRRDLQEKQKQK